MPKFLKTGLRVKLRRPTRADAHEFIPLMLQSQSLHHPWCFPPTTEETFLNYVKSRHQENQDGFLFCHAQTHAIMGVINLNEIVRGGSQSAYLGYYIGAPYAHQGYMQDALRIALEYAFGELQLHRLEANIQPENEASLALVKQCGFRKEGCSPRYLNIGGEWKDHERWAILAEEYNYAHLEGELHTELADGRQFVLTPGMSYQVADDAEPHRPHTSTGAKLFIVD